MKRENTNYSRIQRSKFGSITLHIGFILKEVSTFKNEISFFIRTKGHSSPCLVPTDENSEDKFFMT